MVTSARNSARSLTISAYARAFAAPGRIARQRAEVGEPADFLQFPESLQVLGDRDRVAGLRLTRKRRNALENDAVIGAEEVIGGNHVADVVPGGAIEHQAAEHRLLRFDGMRRGAQIGCA